MRDVYNGVVGVIDKYKVTKSDQELCMLMASKNQDTQYARWILDKLKLNSPNFDRLCNNVSEIRDSSKARIKGEGMRRMFIFLLFKVAVNLVENAELAGKSAETGPKSARTTNGICTVVVLAKAKGEIFAMVALQRCAISVK